MRFEKSGDMMRRRWLVATAGLLAMPSLGAAQAAVQVTDLRGKQITLPRPAQRMVLCATDDYIYLSMLDALPARRVVAWNKWRLDKQSLSMLGAADPRGFSGISQLAIDGPQNLHAEALIALAPDLVVLDPFYAQAQQAVARLEKAGIPVAVLQVSPDLRDEQPTRDLVKFGTLLGLEARARELAAFLDQRCERIRNGVKRMQANGTRFPKVLMEPHAGSAPCCLSMGAGKNLGDMVRMTGGQLMGGELISGMAGQLSAEYVIDQNPDVYIGTGGLHLQSRGGLLLGPGVNAQLARESLLRVIKRTGIAQTRAVQNGNAHGIWHGGLGIVSLECIARWLHPREFADVNPAQTMQLLNQQYLSNAWQGSFWTSAA